MVIVAFPPGEKYAVNYTTLDQYDYGQVLRIQGLKLPKTVEVHFSTQETGGTSITRVGVTKDGATDVLIPDSVLENGDTSQNYSIFAFVYVTDATSGKTEYRARLEVKARPKPEIPGGGDNPDIFHEAVLEVRKSAEKAEEAQKQAEGWAHGREDLPERAEDNAMHYAGKASEDAKKTAQDKAEVERLTESNTQMQGEVAKDLEEVKKLSSQAHTSATNAALSEQKSEEAATRAETAQTGAETAEDNAELAAQKTGQDKTAVEQAKKLVQQMGQEVLDNKNAVDKTVQDFGITAQQALADVNNAGQTQTERVQSAGTTAVENIKTAQNTATQAVETAKTEAVKAVQTEGTTQTGNVTAEGEKQVQAVQAAAQEIIADREQIQKNETDIAELRQKKSDAIVNTVSGTLLNIKDSSGAFFEDFSMRGKSEQVQTTGKNLFNVDNIIQKTMPGGKTYWGYSYVLDAGDYTISCLNPNSYDGKTDYLYCRKLLNGEYSDNGIIYVVANGFPKTKKITIEQSEELVFFNATPHNESDSKEKSAKYLFQLEKGASATTYEPYTGGKPSPSPEYPQEIVNAGQLNEDTGKYEVDVKVTGKNIVNIPDFGADTPETVKECYISKNICISAQEKADVSKGIWRFKALHKDGSEEYITDTALPGCFYATEENPIVSIIYRSTYITSGAYKGIMVEYGTVATPYEPYKEQTLTLTSDRPLTKWDRLVEQDGQVGWLYASKKYVMTGNEIFEYRSGYDQEAYTNRFITINDLSINRLNDKQLAYCKILKRVQYIYAQNKLEEGIDTNANQLHIKLSNDRIGVLSSDDTETRTTKITEYIKNTYTDGIEIMYMSNNSVFVPLPQPEQDAIRALQTYYPTTVVSNSEDAEMELSYAADTKNYTDRKIEEAVSVQIQNLANLLSLMPLSTQAAMIENDTNNILDMEVQK